MGLQALTHEQLADLPSLPDQVLLRDFGLVRQSARGLCKDCGELLPWVPVYEGDYMYRLECLRCGSITAEGIYPEVVFTEHDNWLGGDEVGEQEI